MSVRIELSNFVVYYIMICKVLPNDLFLGSAMALVYDHGHDIATDPSGSIPLSSDQVVFRSGWSPLMYLFGTLLSVHVHRRVTFSVV